MIISIFDFLGTFAFAITGGVKAARRGMDWFGVIVLSIITGTGGGLIRDALLGNHPPAALNKPAYAIICIFAGILVIVAQNKVTKFWFVVMIIDAIGLGFFTYIGAAIAENSGAGGVVIVSTTVLTAVGGGIVRDVLAGEIPQVLRSDFYATAALIGGFFFWIFGLFTTEHHAVKVVGTITITIILRLYAMYAKLGLPKVK